MYSLKLTNGFLLFFVSAVLAVINADNPFCYIGGMFSMAMIFDGAIEYVETWW